MVVGADTSFSRADDVSSWISAIMLDGRELSF